MGQTGQNPLMSLLNELHRVQSSHFPAVVQYNEELVHSESVVHNGVVVMVVVAVVVVVVVVGKT